MILGKTHAIGMVPGSNPRNVNFPIYYDGLPNRSIPQRSLRAPKKSIVGARQMMKMKEGLSANTAVITTRTTRRQQQTNCQFLVCSFQQKDHEISMSPKTISSIYCMKKKAILHNSRSKAMKINLNKSQRVKIVIVIS